VRTTEELWERFGYGLAIASIVAVAVVLVWRAVHATATARVFAASCVVGSIALYALSLYQRQDFLAGMVPPAEGAFTFIGMRYELFPAALLLLALLVPTDLTMAAFRESAAPPPPSLARDLRARWLVVATAVVWVAVAFVPSYRLTTFRSQGPDWPHEVADAQQACSLAVAGEGSVRIEPVPISPSPEWVVLVPCPDLVGSSPP
jgi:hypothetical protein